MRIADKFTGLGVALITPFTEGGQVDYHSLERLIEHLEPGKFADFIVVHGTTGESPCLTREERNRVTAHLIDQVGGRCPIVIGLGGNNTYEIAQRMQEMDTQGIDGILSVVPYYNKPMQEGIYRHFSHLASSTSLPIILYNVPGRVGVNMTPDTVLRLARDHGNIVGVKEASGFVAQGEQIAQGSRELDFVVLSGDDDLTVDFVRNGARGLISVAGNAYPEQVSRLVHLAMEGKLNEADMLRSHFRDLNTLLFANGNPAGIKSLLHYLGLIESNTLRLPLVSASEEVAQALQRAHQDLMQRWRSNPV